MKNVCIIGVGGGCGTAVTPLINEYIRSLKIPIVSIVQRPFKFEGKKRREDEFKSNIDIFKKHYDYMKLKYLYFKDLFENFKYDNLELYKEIVSYLEILCGYEYNNKTKTLIK